MTSFILFLGGCVGGFYGASVGSGGLISFPLLILLGYPTLPAIATNRVAAVFLEGSATARYFSLGQLNSVRTKQSILFGALAALGAFTGTQIVFKINESTLNIIVAILLCAIAFSISKIPTTETKLESIDSKKYIFLGLTSFSLGIYGGIFGTGFGTLLMATLLALGNGFMDASIISRFASLLMSATAAAIFYFAGSVDLAAALALGLGFSIGAWVGAKYSVKRGSKYVKFLLIGVTLITIAKLLYEAFN